MKQINLKGIIAMMEKEIFILTEVEFHTSYLINMIEKNNHDLLMVKYIIRNKNNVSSKALTLVHEKLSGLHKLSHDDMELLKSVYGSVSNSELSLISRYGVPKLHALSGEDIIEVDSFNNKEVKKFLELNKKNENCALIFLDCILDDWWIDFFDKKIVNAHSAILPYARGMNAIEQHCLAIDSAKELEAAAGATLHYVDSGIDTGNIIKQNGLKMIWKLSSLWDLKAESYMCAFSLMREYISCKNSFLFSDGVLQDSIGPIYSRTTFTKEVAVNANTKFLKLKQEAIKDGCF